MSELLAKLTTAACAFDRARPQVERGERRIPARIQHEERRIESARALLVDRGYSGFSYADVAEAVGFARRASTTMFRPRSMWFAR